MLTTAAAGRVSMAALRAEVESFVIHIDQIVHLIESHNARNIAILRYMQFGLIALALVGTVALIYMMSLLVVRPVVSLAEGMQRMTAGEFDARLPVETQDEFGDLAEGFNRMASRLQDVYATLEERVADKTRDLGARNRELATRHAIGATMARLGRQLVRAAEEVDLRRVDRAACAGRSRKLPGHDDRGNSGNPRVAVAIDQGRVGQRCLEAHQPAQVAPTHAHR